MSLDLSQVAGQIEDMAGNLKINERDRQAKLALAIEKIGSPETELIALQQKIEASKTTWLVPGLKEKIETCQGVSECPEDYIVLASDGSNIDVDRHQSARCFLINIGLVQLRYGQNPDAVLNNWPRLYYKKEDVVISSPDGKQVPIEGQLLGLKRGLMECSALVETVKSLETDTPVVALVDGSLILWGLTAQAYPDFVVDEILSNGFLRCIDDLRTLSSEKPVAIASYISFPRSTEVVNTLRLAICPHHPVDCDYYCSGKSEGNECDAVSGLIDREIMDKLLGPGDRSGLFISRSSIVGKYYGPNTVCFFYVRLNEEIGRVEVPLWVADSPLLLNMVHSIILDQCQRGFGYPVALAEAHEQAVVTGSDREQFWSFVDRVLADDRVYIQSSAKQQSKRIRWI